MRQHRLLHSLQTNIAWTTDSTSGPSQVQAAVSKYIAILSDTTALPRFASGPFVDLLAGIHKIRHGRVTMTEMLATRIAGAQEITRHDTDPLCRCNRCNDDHDPDAQLVHLSSCAELLYPLIAVSEPDLEHKREVLAVVRGT